MLSKISFQSSEVAPNLLSHIIFYQDEEMDGLLVETKDCVTSSFINLFSLQSLLDNVSR